MADKEENKVSEKENPAPKNDAKEEMSQKEVNEALQDIRNTIVDKDSKQPDAEVMELTEVVEEEEEVADGAGAEATGKEQSKEESKEESKDKKDIIEKIDATVTENSEQNADNNKTAESETGDDKPKEGDSPEAKKEEGKSDDQAAEAEIAQDNTPDTLEQGNASDTLEQGKAPPDTLDPDDASDTPQLSELAPKNEQENDEPEIEPEVNKKKGLITQKVLTESQDRLRDFIKVAEKSNIEGLPLRSGTTVEDLILELIKPHLSSWLNDNLPAIVKNAVEKEIKKLIPQDD